VYGAVGNLGDAETSLQFAHNTLRNRLTQSLALDVKNLLVLLRDNVLPAIAVFTSEMGCVPTFSSEERDIEFLKLVPIESVDSLENLSLGP
jgi:hypothetical protein